MPDAQWLIRPLRITDVPSVLDCFISSADMARQGDVVDLASARAYVANLLSPNRLAKVASPTGTDVVLALVAAAINAENRSAWVFYWSHPAARRKGITSRLVTSFCNSLLTDHGLHRLELGYRLNNPGSQRVAQKAGFVVEGIEREKFLIDDERVDAASCARLASDPWPGG